MAAAAGDADLAVGDRRRQLAGRRARSGDEHHLHLLEHGADARSASCRPIRRPTMRDIRRSAVQGDGAGDAEAPAGAAAGAAPAVARRRLVAAAAKAAAGLTVQGLPLLEAALRAHHGARSEQGRDGVADRARRDAGQHQESIRRSKGSTIPRTGRQGRIGVLSTKTLVIAGEGGFFTTPNGQRGAMLRAYDKATGKEVGAVYMPAPQTGSPMTYMLNGKQYITRVDRGSGLQRRVPDVPNCGPSRSRTCDSQRAVITGS